MNRLGMIAVVSMMVGCATAPVASTPRVPEATAQAEVRQRLDEIWDSAAKRNLNRLRSYHLYGPRFTEFKDGAPRGDAASGERGERGFFMALSDSRVVMNDLAVNVYGDVAITTFHGDFSGKMGGQPIAAKQQVTMVFVHDNDGWKIVHEHFSPLGPAPAQ